MTSTENSFEEIEKPLGGSSTSDQESSDLINDLASESSARMTNSTEDQAGQLKELKELEFELAWKTRDEIICNLNLHTKFLSGLIIKLDAGEKILKANSDLIVALLNLSPKIDGRSSVESFESDLDDLGLNEVLLDLSWDVKSKIVDTLIANHHVVLRADSVANEFKSKLIDRNNELICELLKLRSRTVSKGDHPIEQAAKASESQTTGKTVTTYERLGKVNNSNKSASNVNATGRTASSPVTEEVTILKEELEKLKEVAILKEELEKLKVKIKEVDINRSDATFTFELKGVESLFAAGAGKKMRSELFYCRGIPWFLSVCCHVENGMKYLSVYLHYNNNIIEKDEWSVVGTFEVRLLGPIDGDFVKTLKDKVFKKPDNFTSWGFRTFITMDNLRSSSFIQDDAIKIRVHLTTKNFERFRIEN